jgi:ribonuclease HI
VQLWSDSQYVVNALSKGWLDAWQQKGWRTAGKEPVKNRDLWERLLRALGEHEVTWHWVRGHAGHPENERCDELAVAAANGIDLADDAGFAG